jgi:hypothetical protein
LGTEDIDAAVSLLREAGVRLRRIESAPWVDDVERRLNLRFPSTYRAMVTCYAFPSFEIGEVELFANEGDGSEWDLTTAPFRDPFMSPWLAKHHLLHVAQPYSGSYDPVCFDLTTKCSEPALVQLDHEDILLERKKVRRHAIAPNFLALLRQKPGA